MSTIKKGLIETFGGRNVAWLQALRHAYNLFVYKPSGHERELSIIELLLDEGDVAVDVGANGGDWAYTLSRTVGDTGKVFAFEADHFYYLSTKYLLRMLRCRNVKIFDVGLGDKNGIYYLVTNDENDNRYSGMGYIDNKEEVDESRRAEVELKTLDSIAREHPRILETSLIKCDVEGFEINVLKGGYEVISQCRPYILCETSMIERYGHTHTELYNIADNLGYEIYTMNSKNTIVKVDEGLKFSKLSSENIILIPDEKYNNKLLN